MQWVSTRGKRGLGSLRRTRGIGGWSLRQCRKKSAGSSFYPSISKWKCTSTSTGGGTTFFWIVAWSYIMLVEIFLQPLHKFQVVLWTRLHQSLHVDCLHVTISFITILLCLYDCEQMHFAEPCNSCWIRTDPLRQSWLCALERSLRVNLAIQTYRGEACRWSGMLLHLRFRKPDYCNTWRSFLNLRYSQMERRVNPLN